MKRTGIPQKQLAAANKIFSKMLIEIAGHLNDYAKGKKLERHRAAAYSAMILRHLEQRPSKSNAVTKQQSIAYDYGVQQELKPGDFKAARYATAQAHGVAETSVSKYATRWKRHVEAHLSRLSDNVLYDGLSRKKMLSLELKEIRGI